MAPQRKQIEINENAVFLRPAYQGLQKSRKRQALLSLT